MFQHTAARRRLPVKSSIIFLNLSVSTHSRAEAAAAYFLIALAAISVSTHSRAEAAAIKQVGFLDLLKSFNTQPRGGGCDPVPVKSNGVFVSTHSRAEAAACITASVAAVSASFNTQPRGGGCSQLFTLYCLVTQFQHTAARRRLLRNP